MNIENLSNKKDGFSHTFKSKYKFQKNSKKNKNSKNYSEEDLIKLDNYNKNKINFLEKLHENEDVGFIKTLIKLKQKSNSNLLNSNKENENFEKKNSIYNIYSKNTLALSPLKLNLNENNKKHIKSKSRNFRTKNQYNNLISNNYDNHKNNFYTINNNHNDKKLLINLNIPNNTKPIKIKEKKSHSQTKYKFSKSLKKYNKKNIDNNNKKEINNNLNKTHQFNRRSHSQISKNKKQFENKIPRAIINLYNDIENKRYVFTPKNKIKNE